MKPAQCLIVGIDNHVGAYLARLLDARGFSAADGLGGVGDNRLVARLGIAQSVLPISSDNAAVAATAAKLVFVVSDGSAARADLAGDVIDAAATAAQPPRLIHVTDVGDLASAAVRDTIGRVSGARGLVAANALLEAHDSRLGRPETLTAQIIAAALAASQRSDNNVGQKRAFKETGACDWGWTPEYVDAVLRLALSDRPSDIRVASGVAMTAAEIANHAFEFFRRRAADHVEIIGSRPGAPAIDPSPLAAVTGWRATTTGRDLVRALCEGAADRT